MVEEIYIVDSDEIIKFWQIEDDVALAKELFFHWMTWGFEGQEDG